MAELSPNQKRLGRITAIFIMVSAAVLGAVVLWATNINQRTDNANVFANYIGIAPEVSGRIIRLPIQDNQFVKKGDLLYEIDPLPYQYKLQQAISSRDNLDSKVIDERRKIASQTFDVTIATTGTLASTESLSSAQAAASAAQAQIPQQEAAVQSAEAQYSLAANNLARAEPLLAKQFVTKQQIDQLRTSARAAEDELTTARESLNETRARYQQAAAQVRYTAANDEGQKLKVKQSVLNIDRLQTLLTQKLAEAASVNSAAYDLQRCRVYAPFNARVTNLSISVGQYATVGSRVFALIDTTAWWVVGNFKETQLHHIAPGMPTDIYLMTRPDLHFRGVIQSIGFGVSPEDISGAQSGGLPATTQTLNWVRLAQRFPVRVRVLNPAPQLFRVGATATVVVRSRQGSIVVPADPNVSNVATYGSPNGNIESADR